MATVENQCERFPVGMRVLAVDDDPICLKVLDNLLRKCQYHVTITNQSIEALRMLRENRNKFDLVISDVNMPDMDGFKLLELVGLEMDLPVILLSAHSDTKLVMKGVTHGACDYLLKPVRIEVLKNIWQHVLRRKKTDSKDHNKTTSNEEKAPNNNIASDGGGSSQNVFEDHNKILGKRRKGQDEKEEEDCEGNRDDDDSSSQKKPRVVWSDELHRKFVCAVNQLGLDKAVPKKILDLMSVEGLTRENVASHLQKYRLHLKKESQQASMVAALGGGSSESIFRMGAIDGYADFCSSSGSGRIPSTTLLSSYASGGIFGRLNSPAGAGLNLRGTSSSSSYSPQNISSSSTLSKFANIQPSMFPSTSIELNQSKQNSCAISQLNQNDSSGFAVASGRATLNIANSWLPCVSTNHLMIQGRSSAGASSLNTESFDTGVCSSSNLLEYNRCTENWQSGDELPKFPSSTLQICENFNNDQLPPSTTTNIIVPLEDSRNEQRCQEGLIENMVQQQPSSFTPPQSWEGHKLLDYNHQNFQFKRCFPISDAYMLEQLKSQDGFIHKFGPLDEIMGAMVKSV